MLALPAAVGLHTERCAAWLAVRVRTKQYSSPLTIKCRKLQTWGPGTLLMA